MRHIIRIAMGIAIVTTGWAAFPAAAQPINEPAPAEADRPADAAEAPALPPAPPPPGEEVMVPTEHGVRLTPAMARAMTRAMVAGMSREFDLTPEQQAQFSDAYARRLMRTARAYEEPGQALFEYALESIWLSMGTGHGMRLEPEVAREFGSRALSALPGIRELVDGLLEDAEPVFPAEAMNKLREGLGEAQRGLDRFEERMQRWSQGDVEEGEEPFSNLNDPPAQPEDGQSDAQGAEAAKPRSPEVQQAERIADWTVGSAGVTEWTSFLAQVKSHFQFDEAQSAKADQILEDYRARADSIMTPEWKEAMRENRIKVNLRHRLSGVPTIPWMWRLQYEYDQALKPIRELGWSFRKDILALLTSQQREAALSDIAPRAAEHGWSIDEQDKDVLGVSGGTWSFWKF